MASATSAWVTSSARRDRVARLHQSVTLQSIAFGLRHPNFILEDETSARRRLQGPRRDEHGVAWTMPTRKPVCSAASTGNHHGRTFTSAAFRETEIELMVETRGVEAEALLQAIAERLSGASFQFE